MNTNSNANLNFIALQYLHAWEHNLSIDDGFAFEAILRKHLLDYSVQSLRRIDAFLDEIREQHGLTEESVTRDGSLRALFCLLAFYVGEVIGRSVQSEPQWFSFDAYNEVFNGDPSEQCFETSLVLGFPGNPLVTVSFFKPLISIVTRATDPNGEKSVCFSAGAQIPVALQTGTGSEQPLHRVPPKPWPVDVRAWLKKVPASELEILELPEPLWAETDDMHRLFEHAPDLLRGGRVVWGALIQANNQLFDASGLVADGGAPAEVTYDPQGRAPVESLVDMAQRIFSCKGETFDDPSLMQVSEHLSAEVSRAFGLDVPVSLSSYPLKISTTWIRSRHLHLGHLALQKIPLLVSDDLPGLVRPLPHRFWPEAFLLEWQAFAEQLAAGRGKSLYVPPLELAHMLPMSLIEEGFLYSQGKGVAQSYEKARRIWEKAAEQGSASALHHLARLYEDGLGVDKDWRRAVSYFEQAAQKGNKPSQQEAERIKLREQMGTAFPGAQPESGSPNEWCDQAVQYLQRQRSQRNLERAIELLKRGAKRGHADSLFNLAAIYHNGDHLPRNGRVAMGYLQRAADRGHSEAKAFLSSRKRTLIGFFEWYFRVR